MSKIYYTKNHEWLKIEDNFAIVGITNYAQEQLGELVFVDLPQLSTTITKDEAVVVVESVKAASDVYAPIDGKVCAVNEALADEPSLVNTAPESEGWLWKMEISDPDQLNSLLNESAYQAIIQ